MTVMLARLKPYNPRRGNIIRRFSVFGIKFREAKGWYKVPDEVAAYLRTVCVDNNDPESAPAFDVCTEAEARAMDKKARLAALKKGQAHEPVDVAIDMTDQAVREREELGGMRARVEPVGSIASLDMEADDELPAPNDLTTDDLPKPSRPEHSAAAMNTTPPVERQAAPKAVKKTAAKKRPAKKRAAKKKATTRSRRGA